MHPICSNQSKTGSVFIKKKPRKSSVKDDSRDIYKSNIVNIYHTINRGKCQALAFVLFQLVSRTSIPKYGTGGFLVSPEQETANLRSLRMYITIKPALFSLFYLIYSWTERIFCAPQSTKIWNQWLFSVTWKMVKYGGSGFWVSPEKNNHLPARSISQFVMIILRAAVQAVIASV